MTNTTKPALSASLVETMTADGNEVAIEHDGFIGTIQGHYVTREGKRGVVLQQVGTRVVHVYGEKWIKPALSASPVAQEPVAYQYRACIAGKWGDWTDLHQSVEGFRNGPWKSRLENGTCELRALYAGTPPATPAGLGADEIAFFQAVADGYSGKIEHGCLIVENPKADPQSLALGGVSPNLVLDANAILALLSRAGDQSNSTQKDGSR